jgi:hypothetical protein
MNDQETNQHHMQHARVLVPRYLTVILLLILGVSLYGCKDTVSVSNDIQVPLASLTVTPGTLQPAFSSNTTSYTVDAPTSATSVTVTASPKDNTSTMTINGGATTAGQDRSISLGLPGSTTAIHIVVSSQTGTESTYTVTVTRLLSSDNNLSALKVTVDNAGQPLAPPFASRSLTYTVDVATDVANVTVTATKSDPNAVLSGAVPNEGQATIPLDGPGTSKTISITVTAPNGNAKTYTITVNRAAPSTDNNLSALTVDAGAFALNPAFTADTLSYMVDVPIITESVTLSATKSDPNAVMALGSVSVAAGTATGQTPITLNGIGAPTSASITVTAPSGDVKTYTVTINRVLI